MLDFWCGDSIEWIQFLTFWPHINSKYKYISKFVLGQPWQLMADEFSTVSTLISIRVCHTSELYYFNLLVWLILIDFVFKISK